MLGSLAGAVFFGVVYAAAYACVIGKHDGMATFLVVYRVMAIPTELVPPLGTKGTFICLLAVWAALGAGVGVLAAYVRCRWQHTYHSAADATWED